MARPGRSRNPFSRLRGEGLAVQLFFVVVLPLTAVLLAVAFGGLELHQQAMRDMVAERDARAAQSAAGQIGEGLLHHAAVVRLLAQRAGDGVDPAGVLATSRDVLTDFDGGLAFYAPDGTQLAVQPGTAFGPDTAAPVRALVAEAGAEPRFSSPVAGTGSQGPVVFVAARAGDVVAVGAFVPAATADRALAGQLGMGGEAMLVDASFSVLYRGGMHTHSVDPRQHPGVLAALRGDSGTTYLDVGGEEHVAAYSPVAPVGWALVVEEPWATVESPLLSTTLVAPLVLVPALLLALVALGFAARRIVQPLQALETRANDLAWGRYESIEEPVGGIAEIRHLQAALVHLARKVSAAQQSLHSYIGAITLGQEEERRRLARELHDDTLQSLIALNQRVQMAAPGPAGAAPGDVLAGIGQVVEQSITNLRRQIRALRPAYLEDLGLVAALEMLARETGRDAGLQVEFRAAGAVQRLPDKVEVGLYRMAQEALSNVVRHARAQHAWVRLTFAPGSATLVVSDDGRGFKLPDSPAEFAPHGHFGLLGLHERAELIGATLAIEAAPGEGTRVTVTLPLAGEDGLSQDTLAA